MNKKTVIILAAVSVGGCCVVGSATALLAAMAVVDEPTDMTSTPAVAGSVGTAGGDAKLGGYMIYGRSTPTVEGFAGSLVGNWLLMDGASVDSIQSIHSNHIEVKTSRVGELFHYAFEADGSYTFRYFITARMNNVLWVEKGEWSSDGAQLTLSPSSCTTKQSDCLESGARTYTLTTVQMDELTPDERVGVSWEGVRLTGPFPSFSQGPNPYSYRDLQRVQ